MDITYKGKGKGDVKKIEVEGESDKRKEVTVHHGNVPRKKGTSAWNWCEDFVMEWSEIFITNKRR